MFRMFMLLTLAVGAIACRHALLTNHAQSSPVPSETMSTASITRVSLIAREEKNPPPGEKPGRDRPLGFADVFVRLENPTNTEINLEIQRIEIKDASFDYTYMTSEAPKEILLHPLEISENSFHLTNKEGYSRPAKVKAIVTYQINEQVKVIESEPATIDRH